MFENSFESTDFVGVGMSAVIKGNEKIIERRTFPRLSVTCPVLYRLKPNKRWQVATLEEFSATGISMVCDENMPEGAEIAIQIKPGSIKTVPQLSAEGQVSRCEINSKQRFKVSCKILKVLRNS